MKTSIPKSEKHLIESPAQGSNTTAFVFGSTLAIAVVGAASIVAISVLRPKEDNTILITQVLGFLAPTAAALLALVKSTQTGTAVRELHLAVNSRLTQLLEQTAMASEAVGEARAATAAAEKAAQLAVETAKISAVENEKFRKKE